ncbi:hypothetical protein NDU88_001956 [Pleurodeles waltl]|uniref:Uncharacterized protein n=1 Tax=Pleurodeles waltl TaxID=8319 RepID=A0AAV7UBW4_PLEWA|nr:hypothetical protein NDU88_001956 [Pleurodeles waltl]
MRLQSRHQHVPNEGSPPVWHAPVPAVGNNAAVPGHFQQIWVHTPWKRTETYAFKAALPDPRKNAAGYYKELKQTLDSYVMTLSDIDMLMAAVVPPDIWTRIRRADHVAELEGTWAAFEGAESARTGGAKPEPIILALPDRIVDFMKTMLTPHRINWDNGQDMATEGGLRLFVEKIVANLLPDINAKLKLCESNWPVTTSTGILTMAQYYENREIEEQEKADKKTKRFEDKNINSTGISAVPSTAFQVPFPGPI